ncbi:methyltransferase domain-containing protein [Actinomadura hibisca]|uniref:methyltransferase domain-containing protein n=1 Tax=Actinomadura hibisca TaxID=68565 RepID=UPI0008306CDD|nr:methyltransferase domain-containing protein [Actinomadura hibisca]
MTEPEYLADLLLSAGRLADERWRDGLLAVPRHLFVPARACAVPDRPRHAAFDIDRDADPDLWRETVYSDSVIAVQVDGQGTWTSSCSAPGIVVPFLQELRPLEHHRVLEIGTGTGWTAALLSWRVGEKNVTSVEIDAELSERARANLEAAGYAPRLVVGDGAKGFAEGAPYDRVHVTCGVERVPYAWVEQSRPGAVMVLPWSPPWGPGHLARFTVAEGAAVGRLLGSCGFMMLRSQRRPLGPPDGAVEQRAEAARSVTRVDPRTLVGDAAGLDLAIAGLVPGVRSLLEGAMDGSVRLWAISDDPAWATVDFVPGRAEFEVRQHGARRLWDEVEAAFLRWVGWGQPGRERFGVTVSAEGQRVWLDRPDQPLSLA